jgi:hypothetical protein
MITPSILMLLAASPMVLLPAALLSRATVENVIYSSGHSRICSLSIDMKAALDRDEFSLYVASNALTVCAQRRMNIEISGAS